MSQDTLKLGFVGQGWIGLNLANHFEERGFPVVRYALEPEFKNNRDLISECDVVFIAVPTPTSVHGFDDSALRSALALVGAGKTAVIRSTLLPGTTDMLAELFPNCFVLHVPEFLREATARFDIDNPDRNIVGIPSKYRYDAEWITGAEEVLSIMPVDSQQTTYKLICEASEAEIIKHGGNEFLCLKTVFVNILYDICEQSGSSWDVVAQAMMADPRIGTSHMYPVHQNEHMSKDSGRGAGGHCFPKDWSALRRFYENNHSEDVVGTLMLKAIEAKNVDLMVRSGKDPAVLKSIYGDTDVSAEDIL